MWKYIVRRLLQMIPIIIGISIIIYLIVHIVPGNFIESQAFTSHMSPAQVKHLEDIYGFNDPMYIGYFKWIKAIVTHFDFGDSYVFKKPVTVIMGTYIITSFKMALPAFIIEIIVAIPLGIISATKQYSRTDMTLTFLAFLGISFPSFFLGLLLQKTFALDLKILPLSGLVTPGVNYSGIAAIGDQVVHLIMPVFVLAVINIGSLMRYSRMSMLEIVNQDYIRTARSKGLPEKKVIYKHGLRNALIPIVTLLGMTFPTLFTGAIITETIFGIPGIGYVSYKAINLRDYPLMMAFCMLSACLILIGNLLSDICYSLVDPRVKLK